MPHWFYFSKPSNLAFHNLCTRLQPPPNLRSLLGLGLKFCPAPKYTFHDTISTLIRFSKNMKLKVFYAGETDDPEHYNPKMYVQGNWVPQDWEIPPIIRHRITTFKAKMEPLFTRRFGRNNLLHHHRRALRMLKNQDDFVVINCDKNMGPAILETSVYVERAITHLSDTSTYERLTAVQADGFKNKITNKLQQWLKEFSKDCTKGEQKFLRQHLKDNITPFPHFYLLAKVHKTPWAERPIVSYPGTLLHPLGKWVDDKFHHIEKDIPSYILDSHHLKDLLLELDIPPGARLFTADAKSMYTNIKTNPALQDIRLYLRQNQHRYPNVPLKALYYGLVLIMKYNVFTFGDSYWRQIKGTAMGAPPAPPYATVGYGTHEAKMLPQFTANILFYKRRLDDIIGVWCPSPNTNDDHEWARFHTWLNSWHGLEWIVSDRSTSVDFLDMTISINTDNKITTSLYEKKLNLYLYIPPHSAQPPGVLQGMVFGQIFRISSLCSNEKDKKKHINNFFNRLIYRGYKRDQLLPIFSKAITHYKYNSVTSTPKAPPYSDDPSIPWRQMYLHVQYHPQNTPSHLYQQVWREVFGRPHTGLPLTSLRNNSGIRINIDRMIVPHSRPPNLGNKLSYKKLDAHIGPTV